MKMFLAVFALVLSTLISGGAAIMPMTAMTQDANPDLPWYFPEGIVRTTDSFRQRIELERHAAAMWYCSQSNIAVARPWTVDPDSIRVETGIRSTSSITDPDAEMVIVLDNYIRLSDNEFRVTTLCGQEIITRVQLDVVVRDMIAIAQEAANLLFVQFFGDLIDRVRVLQAEKFELSLDEFLSLLNEPDVMGITLKDRLLTPDAQNASDFFPRELHLGYNPDIPGILGVAWLNTGVVYYNPLARVNDYVKGEPVVLAHEFIHANSNFQKIPLSQGFDPEVFAFLPMLLSGDQMSFAFHQYGTPWRTLAKTYFGFDFEQMRRDVVVFNFAGNVLLNEEKYRDAISQIEPIKAEMAAAMKECMVEYYAEPLAWSAMHEVRGDQNAVFQICVAQRYDPTLLGGREETMNWVALNRPIIERASSRAWESSLRRSRRQNTTDIVFLNALEREFGYLFSAEEKELIVEYFSENPESLQALRGMTDAQRWVIMRSFKGGVR